METYLLEWLSLLGRWAHLVVGIAWIGASFYFVWLDNHLLAPAEAQAAQRGVAGELWAVHGGGFYHAQKYRVAPAQLPAHLHWFYWEAYSTWLTGVFLLGLLYYAAPTQYLIDPAVLALAPWQAVAIGVATLAGGWWVYDALCRSPLGGRPRALSAVLAGLLGLAAWGLCEVFSGRGAYLHFGALLGTIMAANVFFVIIPGQRRAVAAMRAGREPDPLDGVRGKQRSVHNTYFTLPVLFTMISNHYAGTYASEYRALALIGLALAGAAIRSWFVMRHKAHERGGATPVWPLLLGVAALAAVIVLLRPVPAVATPDAGAVPPLAQVEAIVSRHCAGCHAAHPTQPGFVAPPQGVVLETPAQVQQHRQTVRQQVMGRTMPLGNLTGMSDAERQALIAWIDGLDQGAAQ